MSNAFAQALEVFEGPGDEAGTMSELIERIAELGPGASKFAWHYLGVWDVRAAIHRSLITIPELYDAVGYRMQLDESVVRVERMLASSRWRGIETTYRELSACPECGASRPGSVFSSKIYFEGCAACESMKQRAAFQVWKSTVQAAWDARALEMLGGVHWPTECVTLDQVRELVTSVERRWCVFLHGVAGTGKTQQAAEFVRAVITHMLSGMTPQTMDRFEGGVPPFPDVVFAAETQILATLRPNGGKTLEDYQRARWLVIDDMGESRGSDWAYEQMKAILDHRYRLHLPTLITSNLALPELRTRSFYDDRVTSRLFEMCGGHNARAIGAHGAIEMTADYRMGREEALW